MSIAVVAEKPSVARDIARVLGARQRGEGCLHGNGYVDRKSTRLNSSH